MKVSIRTLTAEEIECRISIINENGLSLLLYKDARVDQKILDETFGPFGWKRSHQCIDGNLYCTVSILDADTGQWVDKQDVGTTGYTEKEKSQASDSFKRACFNWGIGRELYTAPFIWIPSERASIEKKDGKLICREWFRVSRIGYGRDREITEITITDGEGRSVFEFGKTRKKTAKEAERTLSGEQWGKLLDELERTGVNLEQIRERYHIENPEYMSNEIYKKVMASLAKTKSNKAA